MPSLTLADFKVGDILEMTSRSLEGEEIRMAEVTAVNYNNRGEVTYCGHYGAYAQGRLATGSGAFRPEDIGTKPFGFHVEVKKVGHIPSSNSTLRGNGWMKGHPGYDLG